MATKITKTEEIVLEDARKIEVRPLNIKLLREFMGVIQKFGEVDDDIGGLDIMIDAVSVALKKVAPDIAENKEYLEENLNMDNIATILSVAGGVDISGDPNLPKTG